VCFKTIIFVKNIAMKFTAIIEKSEDGWFVGQVEEMPAAISQGRTVEELKENLIDALKLLLEVNREMTEREYLGKDVTREELSLV
jgi:predicted RNase H-like HicB family nuclease